MGGRSDNLSLNSWEVQVNPSRPQVPGWYSLRFKFRGKGLTILSLPRPESWEASISRVMLCDILREGMYFVAGSERQRSPFSWRIRISRTVRTYSS